eukprot:CAMPEP_0167753558 /NCGR_PEP_ID=MMETSP0110_2-20121227/7781_1 /TAXON_ID=629695 /ORGANISM="Gymnochlora sp., Strain CCMP2014" /LENGTH=572 /DNA_ID=CAMNT_0007639339 /DNA_START=24 /DNA_END=1742 /DNA_ORIENTATION=+
MASGLGHPVILITLLLTVAPRSFSKVYNSRTLYIARIRGGQKSVRSQILDLRKKKGRKSSEKATAKKENSTSNKSKPSSYLSDEDILSTIQDSLGMDAYESLAKSLTLDGTMANITKEFMADQIYDFDAEQAKVKKSLLASPKNFSHERVGWTVRLLTDKDGFGRKGQLGVVTSERSRSWDVRPVGYSKKWRTKDELPKSDEDIVYEFVSPPKPKLEEVYLPAGGDGSENPFYKLSRKDTFDSVGGFNLSLSRRNSTSLLDSLDWLTTPANESPGKTRYAMYRKMSSSRIPGDRGYYQYMPEWREMGIPPGTPGFLGGNIDPRSLLTVIDRLNISTIDQFNHWQERAFQILTTQARVPVIEYDPWIGSFTTRVETSAYFVVVAGEKGAPVRVSRATTSPLLGTVVNGTNVVVTRIFGRRAKIVVPVQGWVSLVSEDGVEVLKKLTPQPRVGKQSARYWEHLLNIAADAFDSQDKEKEISSRASGKYYSPYPQIGSNKMENDNDEYTSVLALDANFLSKLPLDRRLKVIRRRMHMAADLERYDEALQWQHEYENLREEALHLQGTMYDSGSDT